MSADTAMPRWMQVGLIAVGGAAVVFAVWRLQPRQGALGPVDFTAGGPDALQFCDPLHPKFIAVTDKTSPVVLAAEDGGATGALVLTTATGKPVGADDLVGGQLRLLAVDATVDRVEVGDAAFSGKRGRWIWPVPAGTIRIFADFTPRAIGREMYASCGLANPPRPAPQADLGGLTLTLPSKVSAGQEFAVQVQDSRGASLLLPVTLAAFDLQREGPSGCVTRTSDSMDKSREFRLTFNDPGTYVVWAESGGRQGRAQLRVEP
ncbi:MAG TPA: hypothetical protein VGL42_11155 [Opitutaceae bacterium]|jgi:hypothetical protein